MSNEKSIEVDAQLAKRLELLHERMKLDQSDVESDSDEILAENAEFRDALDALFLIQQVKNEQSASSIPTGGVAETQLPVETKADFGRPSTQPQFKQQTIGRFELRELIGRGGYGMVFRAYDSEVDRDVAIKVPHVQIVASEELETRFVREAKAAGALSHPNIVTVFEAGRDGEMLYIANELVEGRSLAQWLSESDSLPDGLRIAKFVSVLASAIGHAHSRGVLHRDLKPANILLSDNSSLEKSNGAELEVLKNPKIADFGLAKLEQDPAEATRSGMIIGTPAYMAPEQTIGTQDVGPAADIYGLGAIMYELITGRKPFVGSTILETIKAVKDEPPIAPQKLRADVPRDLEAICLKCLEKAPQERYATANELDADLQRFLNGETVIARPVSTLLKFKRWMKRNRALSLSLGVLATVVLVALGVTTALWLQSDFLRKQSENRYQLAAQRADELERVLDDMFGSISKLPEVGIKGMEPLREQMLGKVNYYYASLVEDAPGNPALRQKRAVALLRQAQLKSLLSDPAGAIEIADNLLKILPDPAECDAIQVQQRIDATMVLAREHQNNQNSSLRKSNMDIALETARSAFNSVSQPTQNDRIELAMTLTEIAELLGVAGERTTSNEFALQAVEEWNLVDPSAIEDGEALFLLSNSLWMAARVQNASEKTEQAREFVKRAIQIMEQDLDIGILDSPKGQYLLSQCYWVQGFSFLNDREIAMPMFDRGLEIISDLAELHPLVSKYQRHILNVNYQRGLCHYIASRKTSNPNPDLILAAPIFEFNIELGNELLDRFPEDRAPNYQLVANNLTMKGLVFYEQKDYENQMVALIESRELNQRIFDETGGRKSSQISLLGVDGSIGLCFHRQEKYPEAIDKLKETTEQLEEILANDPDAGEVARYLRNDNQNMAQSLAAMERYDEAIVPIRRAIELCEDQKVLGLLNADYAIYLARVGEFEDSKLKLEACVRVESILKTTIVGIGSRVIEAVNSNSDEDSPERSALLKSAVDASIQALQTLDANPDFSDAQLGELLDNPKLNALKATNEFQDWNESRD